ncbi:DUF2848 domain-containing protein [Pseudohalocynthiibacter aestuariivivens]|jgi:Protein of unknown function (DUF2848)|uniref:DUF2848 domain-containing protein n=1 Tax=Pseudohalocynthiibacter aestuariivivens TaxID=1591409 RepID=A0ABV5JD99_9RHOB|nr:MULTISPECIES: DUF2848 domain-containing protein [Pseudohalocynthiibacter]MBS9717073.1 DUF2848 family protein [Pseudohalocynthiibacter aestuariivivens]MCK0104003.1 DUF2848 domain-containing protein [Pseudohalocynthiibacter sp. F2068]
MQFTTEHGPVEIEVDHLFIAGWTGRNKDAVQHHIDELAAIGVSPPSKVPLYYRVSNTLLTAQTKINVLGEKTSGEAEPMLVQSHGKIWLGLGSDHTDRQLEVTSVAASKQACQKPCATILWDFGALSQHLDKIEIRSWIWENSDWQLYQDGRLAQLIPLETLREDADMPDNSAMLCGTFSAINSVRSAKRFRAVMHDPILDRSIQFEYESNCLPIVN